MTSRAKRRKPDSIALNLETISDEVQFACLSFLNVHELSTIRPTSRTIRSAAEDVLATAIWCAACELPLFFHTEADVKMEGPGRVVKAPANEIANKHVKFDKPRRAGESEESIVMHMVFRHVEALPDESLAEDPHAEAAEREGSEGTEEEQKRYNGHTLPIEFGS